LKIAVISAHTCPLAALGGWETGGMNVYVRELGRALAARGVHVDIITRRQACDTPDIQEYAPGARVIHIDAGPQRGVDKYDVLDYLPEFACGVQRWRALTGISYDLIHSHYWLSGRIGTLFRERWEVPMVSMFHTLAQVKNRVAESAAEREKAIRFEVERRTMAASDRIVAATEGDRAQMVRHYGNLAPITVIPGGVDLQRFHPLPRAAARAEIGVAEEKVVLFVGRIQRLKGLEVLLRAFHYARSTDASLDARLVIVGGLPEAADPASNEFREITRLQRLARRLRIADQVTFVGAVQHQQLPLYYAAADVTVMPSSYESFGLVAVESLACGTPVIASRVGGLASIVRDGETGFLVPWRDPHLFADRIVHLLKNDRLRTRMGLQARPSVERFGWDSIAEQHFELYQELLAERRSPVANRVLRSS
jgi:D-inositol-3-phosphate glycosyltransferase